MATTKANVILSVNAVQPTQVINALSTAAKRLGDDLLRETQILEEIEKAVSHDDYLKEVKCSYPEFVRMRLFEVIKQLKQK